MDFNLGFQCLVSLFRLCTAGLKNLMRVTLRSINKWKCTWIHITYQEFPVRASKHTLSKIVSILPKELRFVQRKIPRIIYMLRHNTFDVVLYKTRNLSLHCFGIINNIMVDMEIYSTSKNDFSGGNKTSYLPHYHIIKLYWFLCNLNRYVVIHFRLLIKIQLASTLIWWESLSG